MTRENGRCETIMRPILRLAAGAAVLVTVGSMSVSLAAADSCTPIDNRIASRIAVAPRTSTSIITTPSPDVPKTTVDGSTVVSHIILTDLGIVRSVKIKDLSVSHREPQRSHAAAARPRRQRGPARQLARRREHDRHQLQRRGPSIFVGLPPYAGTFAPQEWLAQLFGEPIAGDWTLEVTDEGGGDTGTLKSWGADLSQATCAPSRSLPSRRRPTRSSRAAP